MPSRNTNLARKRGFSDIKALRNDNQNFRFKRGRAINSAEERKARGKQPWFGHPKVNTYNMSKEELRSAVLQHKFGLKPEALV